MSGRIRALEDKGVEGFTKFLVCLGFNLTVTARNAYNPGVDTVSRPSVLRGINEMQHQILSRARWLMHDSPRPGYGHFTEHLWALADHYRCQVELENAVMFALEEGDDGWERIKPGSHGE